jgi:hypothetical protein
MALAKKEVEIKEVILDKYRESLASDKKAKSDYISTLITTLDLEVIGLEKSVLEKKLKTMPDTNVHAYIDLLVNTILLVNNFEDLLKVLRDVDEEVLSKATLENYRKSLASFISAIPKLDQVALTSAMQKQTLLRESLVKDIAASKKLKELKTVSEKIEEISLDFTSNADTKPALIHMLNAQLQTYQSTLVVENDPFGEKFEKHELDKTVNELVYLVNGLPGDDFVAFKNLIDSMRNVDDDKSLDLRSKIEQIRRRRNLLQLRYQELKDKHTLLLKNKQLFENLTMVNNMQRGKLDLPLNAYRFNASTFEKDMLIIEKENNMLTEKVKETIQSKVTQEILMEVLKEELNMDFIQSNLDDQSGSELIESYHHLDNGVVLRATTVGGQVTFKPLGVAVPGSRNDDQQVLTETKKFCDEVLPKIEKALKARKIVDIELEKVAPSLNLVTFIPLEQIEPYAAKTRIKFEHVKPGKKTSGDQKERTKK